MQQIQTRVARSYEGFPWEVVNPRVPEANGMANWHNMVGRTKLGQFQFMVGQVPVDVVVYAELNGAASANQAIRGDFAIGAQVKANAKFGMEWDEALAQGKVLNAMQAAEKVG